MSRVLFVFLMATVAAMGQQYPITGSFFLFDRVLTAEQVKEELQQMRAVGMDTVVVFSVGMLEAAPSDPTGYKLSGNGLRYPSQYVSGSASSDLGNLLAAASGLGMKVFIGTLSTAGDWTSGVEFPALRKWNKFVMQEIWNRYGSCGCISGFFFPQEIWINWLKFSGTGYYGATLLRDWAADVKSVNPSLITLAAPVFKEQAYQAMPPLTPAEFGTWLGVLMSVSRLDIVAPQDGQGAGAGAPSIWSVESYYAAAETTSNSQGFVLWSTVETFMACPQDCINRTWYPTLPYEWPANIGTIQRRIDREKPHVKKLISWMFGHDMSDRATYMPVLANELTRSYQELYGPNQTRLFLLNTYLGYTLTPAPASNWSDGDGLFTPWCSGCGGELTDQYGGGYAQDSTWVGINNPADVIVVIPIPTDYATSTVKEVDILFRTETASGILLPSSVTVEISTDGTTYKPFGSSNFSSSQNTTYFSIYWGRVFGGATGVKSVRIRMPHSQWLFMAEVQIYAQ